MWPLIRTLIREEIMMGDVSDSDMELDNEENKENQKNQKGCDLKETIAENKEWIFGALGLCWAAYSVYQFVTLQRTQVNLSRQLNDAVERVKELDLNLERMEQFTKAQMNRNRHAVVAKPRRMMRDLDRGASFFSSGRRHH